jgi:hypothetical protein
MRTSSTDRFPIGKKIWLRFFPGLLYMKFMTFDEIAKNNNTSVRGYP